MKADSLIALKTVFPFVVTCAMFYLIGSFVSVSLDPAEWTADCRVLMCIFGFSFGAALLFRIEHGRS
jgi:hypothetical protein